jgi:predicted transposase YdaD
LPKPLQAFIDCVDWLSLEELGQQADLDPLLALLTLPVRPEAELQASSQQILERRPDLLSAVQTILLERLPLLTREELMKIATIPAKDLRHTRVAQEWIEEGRQEGEASVTLRQLNRRCGPLSDGTAARIKALPLEQLEALAEALLDFSGSADLAGWLAEHSG